ncbi:MAG TPA: site-specific integrase [Vicinamibacterales bacterium]
MTLRKNASGVWEGDFRYKGLDPDAPAVVTRLHLSLGTRKKTEAEPRYQAVRRLFREAKGTAGADRRALIEDLRTGRVKVERIESMVAHGEALVPSAPSGEATAATAAPDADWPTVDVASQRYIDWIEANPKKRKSTWNTARAQLRRFAAFRVDGVPIGERRLDAVTSEMIEAYQQSLLAANTPANTVTSYMTRVSALWGWMQRRENRAAQQQRRLAVILHTPIDPETAAREITRRDRWLTYEEAEALIAATPDELLLASYLGLFAGLRIGEVLSLRRADVDLDLGTIGVAEKQVGLDANDRPVTWKPKTKRAARVVPIAKPVRPVLERHLVRYASADWLFPDAQRAGEPLRYWMFHRAFAKVVQNAELVGGRKDPRGVIYHTLRHTFASWLVQRGVDLYTVAQLLGDTLKMVEDTYAHLAPDYKKRAIAALEGAVRTPIDTPENDTANDTTEAV